LIKAKRTSNKYLREMLLKQIRENMLNIDWRNLRVHYVLLDIVINEIKTGNVRIT
jgi:hypothetical protein